jgi:hypothetical protein
MRAARGFPSLPIGERRLTVRRLVVSGPCLPEQKVERCQHATSNDDKAGEK